MADTVRVEGLADLRRDLRRMQPEVLPVVRERLKAGAGIVAVRGATYAPKGTRPIPASRRPRKRLAATLAPGTAGNSAFVRSRALYGPKIERSTGFLSRALEDSQEEVVDSIGDAIDALASRHGWH